MAKVSHISKRFHLSDKLYIDMKEVVPQHVINGVRFLYKQFAKDKPGVILNDPADFNQETQVGLFLNGIHKSLKQHLKTVLILCETNKVSVWNDCLMKWMPDIEEVAIDWPKPTSKKSVYVVTTDRLECYYRRDWAIVVVDDDSFLQYKLHPAAFKVGYKIFITTDDLGVNLQKFTQIYKWLYPDQKINVGEFRPSKDSISDILEKRIWFEAFVQDILIRNASSQIKMSANTYREVPKEPETRKITRKNKDATGTKIKRTKRKLSEDNTEIANNKILATSVEQEIDSNIDICDSKLIVSNSSNNQTKLDVETFIREQEPLKMEEFNEISDIDDNMLTSERMDVTETKDDIDVSDSENSNCMKLIYPEDVSLNSNDGAYSLETQDNGLENNDLEFKEHEIINTNVSIDEVKYKYDDLTPCTKVENDLIDSKLNLIDADTENEVESKDEINIDVKDDIVKVEAKSNDKTNSNDLDSKWEEMALKKFKGSLLDRIF